MDRRLPLALALLFLVACRCDCGAEPAAGAAAAGIEARPATLGAMPASLLGDVYVAGQPSPADLAAARDAGVRAVVDLRRDAETPELDEARVAGELGLAYYNPAYQGPGELDDAVMESALAALRAAPRPVLLHCGSANRTGPVWIAYRVLDGGADLETAVAEATAAGMRTPEYEQFARDYVRRHAE